MWTPTQGRGELRPELCCCLLSRETVGVVIGENNVLYVNI